MGHYKIFRSHAPLTEAGKHFALKRIGVELDALSPGLPGTIKEMEHLAPTPFGKNDYDPSTAENAEYPFLVRVSDPSTPASGEIVELRLPSEHWEQNQARKYFDCALELIITIRVMYPPLALQRARVPRGL